MNTTKQTYKIAKQRQLIDLNGDMTNFDLTFTATSKDGKSFNVIVVDQETLDSNAISDMKYKTATGSISGNIVADKNEHQNYYLCLKADSPCDVDIEIVKKPIAPRKKVISRSPPPMPVPTKNSYITPKNIILLFVIVVGGILLYYLYCRPKNTDGVTDGVTDGGTEDGTEDGTESGTDGDREGGMSPGSGGLLSKLKRLSMH